VPHHFRSAVNLGDTDAAIRGRVGGVCVLHDGFPRGCKPLAPWAPGRIVVDYEDGVSALGEPELSLCHGRRVVGVCQCVLVMLHAALCWLQSDVDVGRRVHRSRTHAHDVDMRPAVVP
jgi:hypothetical protein